MRVARVDPASPKLAALLTWLQLEALPHDDPLPPAAGDFWWVAYDKDQPVAFAALRPSSQFSNVGYLSRCGVVPSKRGQGLQRRLLLARERFARRQGWTHLVTDTRGNPASSNNLIRCGYRMYTPSSPWGFDDACYWIKAL